MASVPCRRGLRADGARASPRSVGSGFWGGLPAFQRAPAFLSGGQPHARRPHAGPGGQLPVVEVSDGEQPHEPRPGPGHCDPQPLTRPACLPAWGLTVVLNR